MLKGFLTITSAVVLVAVTPHLPAQVYRCESASGVMYSDFPCSDSAEEIELEVLQPASQGIGSQAAATSDEAPEAAGDTLAEESQTLDDLKRNLNVQRDAQIGQLDRTLADLRKQVESSDIDGPAKAELMMRIAQIESSKETILSEYDARAAEAESQAE